MSILTGMCFISCSEDEPTPEPVITSGLTEGVKGSDVTITGTNFSTDTTKIEVTVGGIVAKVTGTTETTITFTIPDGVTAGDAVVVVKIDGKLVDLEDDILTVKNKIFTITGLSKSSGKMGDRIKIEGSNLNSTDFTVFMNNGSGINVKQKIKSAAADGSYIEIELVAKTFSGRFEVTRISDNVMVTTGKFEYEESYSIEEVVPTGVSLTTLRSMSISPEGNYYFTGIGGVYITNSNLVAYDTIRHENLALRDARKVLFRNNGDILFGSQSDHLFKYKSGDEYDTIIDNGQLSSYFPIESSTGIVYYGSYLEGKIKRFSGYNTIPDEIVDINSVGNLIFEKNDNIIANSETDNKLYLVDVENNTKEVYLDYSSTIVDGTELSQIIHPISNKMYLFSNTTDAFYVVNSDKTLQEISFSGIIFDNAQDLLFDKQNNLYLICMGKLYYLSIK